MAQQPYPGDAWFIGFQREVRALYEQQGQTLDVENVVWASRAAYDIGAGLSREASMAKHLAELRLALGLVLSGGSLPTLRRNGARLVRPDGSPWDYVGVTAFQLLAVEPARQDDFLGWVASLGLTEPVVRVFTTAVNLFDLHPADGYARLLPLLEKAAGHRVRVEAVALCDTSLRSFDFAEHLRLVRALPYANLLVEGANEPLQSFQANVRDLVKQPGGQTVVYAAGAADDVNDESNEFATGDYLTVHASRSDAERGWRWVRHTKECWYDRRIQTGRYPVNGEPRRDDLTPAKHFALGCMAWICGGGDLFHYAGGRFAQRPTEAEAGALAARIQGWRARPSDFRGSFFNAGWTGSPVRSFTGALRCYSARQDNVAYTVALDAENVGIEFGEGFRVVDEQRVDGSRDSRLYRLERR